MALQGSGAISLVNIATEFGGATPHGLSEYYRGGALVPNASQNNAIATSGAISMGSFYNAVNRVSVTVTIAADQTNYVFNTAKVAGYVAGITDVIFNINSGVRLSASSTGVYGGNVDTSWNAGDTVRINNNGGILVGVGGVGGAGSGTNGAVGAAGAGGGPAFIAQRAVSFNNGGTIAGGGGGGGGGRAALFSQGGGKDPVIVTTSGGGGGGGGQASLAANAGGGAGGNAAGNVGGGGAAPGATGGTGTYSGPGGGGAGGSQPGCVGGAGGAGGTWGVAGASGGAGSSNTAQYGPGPYGGGAAGVAVAGNGNITWVATGTRLGAIT